MKKVKTKLGTIEIYPGWKNAGEPKEKKEDHFHQWAVNENYLDYCTVCGKTAEELKVKKYEK